MPPRKASHKNKATASRLKDKKAAAAATAKDASSRGGQLHLEIGSPDDAAAALQFLHQVSWTSARWDSLNRVARLAESFKT